MAHSTIYFKQPNSGKLREAPVGFSWTTLFFGFLPALLRGHWTVALIMALLSVLTLGISGLIFPFIYNAMYIKHLIAEGYQAESASSDLRTISTKLGREIPILPEQTKP